MPPKQTATYKAQYAELAQKTNETLLTFRYAQMRSTYLPEEWKDIALTPVPAKTRVTLRLDADVARFFRKLGKGYQETLNDVLRSFMLARLTEAFGEVEEPFMMLEADEGQALDIEAEKKLRRHLEEMVKRRLGWIGM
ncbi:BrnA antitoxin family protein [Yoonia sp. 208BN28-4]|uniref:BrnA antitoxin family protein n=1 Tax=Yoonia sp. 208BN28-4 TaxID=3126505 RepID=UPI003099A594